MLLPMHELTPGDPPTHRKLLPTSGVAVTTVGTVALKGRRNEAEHPVQRMGGLPGTRRRPWPFPEAERSSVRAGMNFLCTLRLATMSTKQVEPLRRVQPVQLTNMLSVPGVGVSATVVP